MRKLINRINQTKLMKFVYTFVPQYALLPLLSSVIANTFVYYGARIINEGRIMNDFTTQLDIATPFTPWFVLIYVIAFPYWVISYLYVARQSREDCYRMVVADVIGKLICGAIFLLIPTTNIRPVVEDGGLWNWGMQLLYSTDKADNLFPSIHCLESWMCFTAVKRSSNLKLPFKVISFVLMAAICVSTVCTKQHVWVDVAAGVIIAEMVWQLAPAAISMRQAAVARNAHKRHFFGNIEK